MTAVPPSAQQYELVFERQKAVVVQLGAALRHYESDGTRVLDGYAIDEVCSGARGQLLLPWPNRIQAGRYDFGGHSHQLDLTEPDKHNAIHGLIRWMPWEKLEQGSEHVALGFVLHPMPGYPFTLRLRADYRLKQEGLRVAVTATNLSPGPCPFAAGAHPYLSLGTPTLEGAWLTAPGRTWYPTDARGIPTGAKPVSGSPMDFRAGRPLDGVKLDFAFSALERDPDGRAWVQLSQGPSGRAVALWVDDSYPFLEIFTGDTLKDASRRRTGLGVEPMTCAPNGFQTGEGLRTLEPGETFQGTWGISPSGRPESSRGPQPGESTP